MSRLLRALVGDAVPLSWGEANRSAIAAFCGLGFTALFAWLLRLDAATPLLLTPIAASTVILFAIPHSPLAQPWSFAGGSTLAALVGLACALLIPDPLWAGLCAVPLAIWLMGRTACLHPPAGAQALAFALAGRVLLAQGWRHALWPLALNLGGMLIAAFAANNLLKGRRYPFRAEKTATHATRDPEPLARLGIRHEDLRHAMTKMDTFLDIAEADLVSVYALATQHAFQRTTQLTCGDLMSRDVISVEFATDLEEAWHSLRDHHFKALPVIDRARRVIGIVTQADFIRHAEGVAGSGSLERLKRLLRPTPGPNSDKAEVVGQIMSVPACCVAASAPLSDALAVLATVGKHHVPVLDEERRLVGMLTQSDLLAALYARLAIQPAGLAAG
ncbi:HPP family protein [Niveibacterium sp. SC-1]|uniref:HPP family protein n=1 Tax=Niveibacterium sp. SC-1 TaxID=3135646 RepID=UPI00311DE8A2